MLLIANMLFRLNGLLQQSHNGFDGVYLTAFTHGLMISLSGKIQLMYPVHQQIGQQVILIDHNGKPLSLKGLGVQEQIPPADGRSQGDQDIRLLQSQKLKDGIGPCTGNHYISHCKQIL